MKNCLITASCVLITDAFSKFVCMKWLKETYRIGNLLHLTLKRNAGIALGLFSENLFFTLILPPLIIVIVFILLFPLRQHKGIQFAYGLILGGFIGNYLERLFSGSVTDIIFFPWIPWFICNVADIAICFGSVLLIYHLLFSKNQNG